MNSVQFKAVRRHPTIDVVDAVQKSSSRRRSIGSRASGVELCVNGSELTVHPVLWAIDHTSSIICRYLHSFYTGTELCCLVIEAKGCEQLA